MAPSWQQLLIVLVLVLVLFGGRGRISSLMGDMAKGVRSFREGLKDDGEDEAKEAPRASLGTDPAKPAPAADPKPAAQATTTERG